MVNEKPKRRFRRRKIAKIILSILAGLLVLLVLTIVVLRLLYPPERIKAMVVEYVRNEFHRELSIDYVSINPFRGFILHDLEISPIDVPKDSTDFFPIQYARISHAELRYSLRNIFDKQLLVDKFVIDTLDVSLAIFTDQPDTIKAFSETKEDSAVTQLPLRFDIQSVAIHRARLHVKAVSDSLEQHIELTNLSLSLNDWTIPKGEPEPSGQLTLELQEGSFRYHTIPETVRLETLLDISIASVIHSMDNIELDFELQCPRLTFTSPEYRYDLPLPVKITSRAGLANRFMSVGIPMLSLSVGDQEWMNFDIKMEHLNDVNVRITQSQIPLQQLIALATPVIPDSLLNLVYISDNDAGLSFQGTTLRARLPMDTSRMEIDFDAKIRLDPMTIEYLANDSRVQQVAMEFQSRGQIVDSSLSSLNIYSKISLDSAFVGLSDTTEITAGALYLEANSDLDSLFLPTSLSVKGEWQNIMGALLTCQMDFQGHRAENLTGQGLVRLENLEPHRLSPDLPETNLNMTVNLATNTLEDIQSGWTVSMDTIRLNTFPPQSFAPLKFQGELQGRLNPASRHAHIESVQMQVNDIFSAHLNGHYSPQRTVLNINKILLNHKEAFNYLPAAILEKYYDLRVSGQTTLEGRVTLDEGGLADADAHLYTSKTNLEYPSMGIFAYGIGLNVRSELNPQLAIHSLASLAIDSVITDQVKGLKLQDNLITLELSAPDFDSVIVDSLVARIPSLGLNARANSAIDSLSGNPKIFTVFQVTQDSQGDTLFLLPDVGYTGALYLNGKLNSDTLLATADLDLKANNVSFVLPQQTVIRNISGSIHGEQSFDLQRLILIQRQEPFLSTPSEGTVDYEVYGPYYDRMYPEINELNIASIQAAGYRVENIGIKSLIKNGRIEIPSVTAQMYDGDLVGRLSLDMAQGELENARYHISAHFSNINSELLWAEQERTSKKSILNGNVELDGKGIDPRSDMQLGGHFNITEIGSKVMLDLLRAADPEGKDSGVNITQRLVNWGFKPQLVNYNIRHGYFQTTVYLDPPWYFPIRLGGGKIEFTRKPLDFFLDQFQQTFTNQ